MGSHRVGHDWNDTAAAAAAFCMYINNLIYLKKIDLILIYIDPE